jgi:hypothetical protein
MAGHSDRRETTGPVAAASDRVREELVTFVRALRAAGAEVPANAGVTGASALGTVGLDEKERVRAALRAALLTRVEDRSTFDRLFEQFWSHLRAALNESDEADTPDADEVDGGLQPLTVDRPPATHEAEPEGTEDSIAGERTSQYVDEPAADPAAEEFRTAQYSPAGASEAITAVPAGPESAATEAAVGRLTDALAGLAGRRPERTQAGRRPDVRRAIRESIATGGVVTSVPETRPRRSEVRGAVFADVSRSVLDVVDREFLVDFLRAVLAAWRSARVFLFDTDVQEATRAFDADSTAAAYAALERAEAAWGGGTRIGHALTHVRETAPEAVDRRTVVLVISDGLEMGDVAALADGMAWLDRRSSVVLWLNPLATSSEYEPTAAGMAAALPHVDALVPFSGPADVDELARQLVQYQGTRSVGYQDGRSTEA